MTAGPGAIATIALAFLLLIAWGVAMAGIAFFGDRMAPQLVAQQNDLQENYEQRVGALQAEIQRLQGELDAAVASAQGTDGAATAGQPQPGEMTVAPARPALEGRVVELARALSRMEARLAAMGELTQSLQTSLPGAFLAGPRPTGATPLDTIAPNARASAASSGVPASSRERRGPARPTAPPEIPEDPSLDAIQPHDDRGNSALQFWRNQQRPADRRSELQDRSGPLSILPVVRNAPDPLPADAEKALPVLERRLAAAEGALLSQASAFGAALKARIEGVKAMLVDLDVEAAPVAARPKAASRTAAALATSERGTPFGLRLEEARTSLAELAALRPVLSTVPFAPPVSGSVRTSSRFGPRSDPFLGTARLHSGLDFAGPTGTPITATGAGVVLSAGWGGGYGNLVQIDHGNGVVTRYAHLSEIRAVPGQPVARGQVIGLLGSTGRSTGPHLHYETRMSGEAVDPMDFIEAGSTLGFVRQGSAAP